MVTVTNKAKPPRKTKPKGRHPDKALSAAFVRTAPPGRHADGNGLYLFVQPSGTRSWIQRLLIRGRRRELGLGSVALVSLAEAREKALANRKLAREGGDCREASCAGRTELRRSHRACGRTEASRVAKSDARPRVDLDLRAVRLPAHREDAGLGGH